MVMVGDEVGGVWWLWWFVEAVVVGDGVGGA